MLGLAGMEQIGCDSIGCWTHYVTYFLTLPMTLDLDFWG